MNTREKEKKNKEEEERERKVIDHRTESAIQSKKRWKRGPFRCAVTGPIRPSDQSYRNRPLSITTVIEGDTVPGEGLRAFLHS